MLMMTVFHNSHLTGVTAVGLVHVEVVVRDLHGDHAAGVHNVVQREGHDDDGEVDEEHRVQLRAILGVRGEVSVTYRCEHNHGIVDAVQAIPALQRHISKRQADKRTKSADDGHG